MTDYIAVRWAQGYSGVNSNFIDNDTICQKCGHMIKFISLDGSSKVFRPPLENVAFLAVHPTNRVFAVGENDTLDPKILIYDYPWFNHVSTINGAAAIDITSMTFSTSEFFCTTSGVPDFNLMLWNYTNGKMLCSVKLNHEIPSSISFDPTNWRHICMTVNSLVYLWNVEQCENIFLLQKKVVKMLPVDAEEGFVLETEKPETNMMRSITRTSTRMSRMSAEVPKTAITGLVGERYNEFESSRDITKRTTAISHAWNIHGDLFIGCQEGHLVKLDFESLRVRMLLVPTGAITRDNTMDSLRSGGASEPAGFNSRVGSSPLHCLALNRTGLYVGLGEPDGLLRLLVLGADGNTVVEARDVHQMPSAVSELAFNVAYNRLLVGCAEGRLDLLTSGNQPNAGARTLLNSLSGKFIGAVAVCGREPVEECVSVRENGTVQTWSVASGHLMSILPLGGEASAIAAYPLAPMVCVATGEGFIFFLDFSNPVEPRLIHRVRLFETAVRQLAFDPTGQILVAACDGTAILINPKPSSRYFEPLGFIDYPGRAQDIHVTWDTEKERIQMILVSVSSEAKSDAANRLTFFEFSKDVLTNPLAHHASLRCDFKGESLRRMELYYTEPKFGCFIHPGDAPRLLAVSEADRCLEMIQLPEEPPKKAGNKASFMGPEERYFTIELDDPKARLASSTNGRVLAAYGADGTVRLMDTDRLNEMYSLRLHDGEGISGLSFSPDGTLMFTCGSDGSLVSTVLKAPAPALRQSREDYIAYLQRNHGLIESETQALAGLPEYTPTPMSSRPMTEQQRSAADSEALYATPTPQITSEHTWLQVKELEAHQEEDQHYTETKKELRRGLHNIKKQIQEMVDTNATLPDLEKLDRQEFELDVEEQARILAETETVVQKVREDIEFQNLAKQFTHSVIKRECWDNMMVKGRAIAAFNSPLEVHNFPMKTRTKEELDELEDVKVKRQIEINDTRNRKELIDSAAKAAMTADEGEEIEEDEAKDPTALLGSSGAAFGGGSELAYSQFELHTRQQKIRQIVLLQDSIYRIKEFFNKDFDDVYKRKEMEIGKVKDKNVRIKKILADLDLLESQPVIDPALTTSERPELLLVVEDHEVTVEKYLTPEQRKKLEEARLAEEERKRRERADNWRERGLDDMMGGVLEVKKEDELKKDIPKPAFMLQKPEEEWSEEEKKMAQEYERKVKELNEEREKYRKQLESELKKLTTFIDEGKAGFDESLNNLFQKKIKTQMALLQEELKIWRLRFDLLMEEEMRTRELELSTLSDEKKHLREKASIFNRETREVVELFRENYDILSAEDKVQEKNFKKEFSDLPGHYVDQLFKLYKRRPRRGAAAHTPSHSTLGTATESPLNPYADRPTTAKQNQQQRTALDAAVNDMDNERNMPDGIEPHVWRRLCRVRRDKIEKEQNLKQRALDLAEMNAFLQRRHEEEEALRTELVDLDQIEHTLREDRRRFENNLQVQLLLKQGQVEVDTADGFIHDFTDSILIHRSVVEDLNTKIRGLGEAKVQHMMEGKDFKKRFIHLEWELKKMTMEVEDLRNKAKDIQSFKISREVQRYLNSEDYDGLIAMEIQKLEQAMGLLKKHHERTMDQKDKKIKFVNSHVSKQLDSKNSGLKTELTEMNVSLNERIHIDEVTDKTQSDASEAEQRYRQILQRQKLVDLAKAQAKEVAVLRAEVERLRMRTFPALVQNK